jgi:Cu(I)/Ag(I) efflux system membrane fusion protein
MTNKQILTYIGILILGIVLGWLLFGGGEVEEQTEQKAEKSTTWTCSMHPSVEKSEMGQCPICGMDLIPKKGSDKQEDGKAEAVTLEMSAGAKKLAQVQTTKVKNTTPTKKLRLNGKVKADETRSVHQTAHFPGRIDKLYMNYTGQYVRKGQKIATLFSPELITAQRELFEALKTESANPSLVKAAKNKLRLLKLPESQIQSIIDKGEVQTQIDFRADVSGYVIEKNVNYGDHVKSGTIMYKVADLSRVWVDFEAYEQDLKWLQVGTASGLM